MKLKFDLPLKAWTEIDTTPDYDLIYCPSCGSTAVYVYTRVVTTGAVNVNTMSVDDIIDDCEADFHDARNETERHCIDCRHEWEVDAE